MECRERKVMNTRKKPPCRFSLSLILA
jgi:hypothetical protein